jgi:hypothetical protein
VLAGESDTGPQLQIINGIRFNKWFTGIGSGIDYYYHRSIPVFLMAERGFKIGSSRNIYFSSGAGINFPWDKNYYNDWNWWSESKSSPGFYWNTGFGYKIPVGKNSDAVLLHIGFSIKFFKEKIINNFPCFNPPCPVTTETYRYNLRAFSFKLGYGF